MKVFCVTPHGLAEPGKGRTYLVAAHDETEAGSWYESVFDKCVAMTVTEFTQTDNGYAVQCEVMYPEIEYEEPPKMNILELIEYFMDECGVDEETASNFALAETNPKAYAECVEAGEI